MGASIIVMIVTNYCNMGNLFLCGVVRDENMSKTLTAHPILAMQLWACGHTGVT